MSMTETITDRAPLVSYNDKRLGVIEFGAHLTDQLLQEPFKLWDAADVIRFVEHHRQEFLAGLAARVKA